MKPPACPRTLRSVTGTGQNESELWRRASGGDGHAFAALFDLHRDRVYRQAARLFDGRNDAEDITASAFLELWRRRSDVRLVNGSVLPWLLVTTANLARNAARARRRYHDFLARLPHATAEPDTADAVLARWDVDLDPQLRRALRSLSQQDMALLILVAFEDFSLSDAAAVLGVTPTAAKTRLHRARRRIQKQLSHPPAALDRTGAQ